ncbi:MAG: hypothetical protein WC819_06795 [Parcubacteria group bacterium]|jgi:hypothetical protein
MSKKNYLLVGVVFCCVLFFCNVSSIFAASYTLIENVPWAKAGDSFPTYITGLYNFLVAVTAIAALLMITIGGFYYVVSAGNQAQAGTAKKIISDALLGLVIVFVTWLILHTINPDLLEFADLSKLQQSVQSGK